MNTMSGMTMLVLTAVFFLKYRPKSRNSLFLCMISVIMGGVSVILSDSSVLAELTECFLQVSVLICCFVKLRRERELLNRRKARLKNCKCGRFTTEKKQPHPRVCA